MSVLMLHAVQPSFVTEDGSKISYEACPGCGMSHPAGSVTDAAASIAGSVACSRCEAVVGEPCTDSDGTSMGMVVHRRRLSEAGRDHRELVAIAVFEQYGAGVPVCADDRGPAWWLGTSDQPNVPVGEEDSPE